MENIEILKGKISAYDVISFDIFDTLITRPLLKPTDLFDFISKISKVKNFKEDRINAEISLRQKYIEKGIKEEITFDEIYNYISVESKVCKELELKLEYDFCQKNNEMFQIYQYATKLNKKVIFISDMYLDIEFIKKILHKEGYTKYNDIYLSSDNLMSKATGTIYKHIKNKYKNILHIGDNYHTDYKNAIKNEIDSYHYKSLQERFYENSVYDKQILKDIDFSLSFVFGILITLDVNNKNLEQQLVSQFVWPIVISFTTFLNNKVKELALNQLEFCARDGYIFYETYNDLFKNEISSKFYASRRLTTIPYVDLLNDGLFYLTQSMEYSSIDELWSVLNINCEDYSNLYHNFVDSFSKVNFNNFEEIYNGMKNFLLENDDIISNIMLDEKERLKEYLRSKNILSKVKIGFVDIGWSGSLQRSIYQASLEDGIIPNHKWFYLATEPHFYSFGINNDYALLSHHGEDKEIDKCVKDTIDIIEILFTAPIPGIKALDKNLEPLYCEANEDEKNRIDLSKLIFEHIIEINGLFKNSNIDLLEYFQYINIKNILKCLRYGLKDEFINIFSKYKTSPNMANINYKELKLFNKEKTNV